MDLNLSVYPVKGYSLTLPVTNFDDAPMSTILDKNYKITIARFDNRIRVSGTAELSGYRIKLLGKHRETLALIANDSSPRGGDLNQALSWGDLGPVTFDSMPSIDRTHFDNLFLSTGHDTSG